MASPISLIQRIQALLSTLSGMTESDIEPESDFLEMGYDSLFLTQFSQEIRSTFGVEVKLRQLVESENSINLLAEYLGSRVPEQEQPQETSPEVQSEPSESTAKPSPQSEDVEAIIAKQLELMREQLELLGSTNRTTLLRTSTKAPEPKEVTSRDENNLASLERSPITKQKVRGKALRVKGFDDLNSQQQESLRNLIEEYVQRTSGSRQHVQSHRPHHADPRTAALFNRAWKEMVYPIVVERSEGARIWDIDGNSYVDLLNGFGPNFLGHSHPQVTQAIQAQLQRGIEVGPQSPLAGETAGLVCELTGFDRASFFCTGSEAVQAAIRCARTYTGRSKIVLFSGSYHGNFDEVIVRDREVFDTLAALPAAPGIPKRAVEDIIVLPYGEEESLNTIEALGSELAAVLVEPVQSRRPELQPREFLHELRKITESNATLLIFDEVVTGFRCHPAGAQGHFEVSADLATYGKVAGANMPIGIVAGRSEFMDTFDGGMWQYGDDSAPEANVTFFAGTFVRHPLAIAASHAMLSLLKKEGPKLQEELGRRTEEFVEKVNAIFHEFSAPIELTHFSSVMYLRDRSESELGGLLWYFLRLEGVYAQQGFPSYLTLAHGDSEIEFMLKAFRNSVSKMAESGFYPRATRRLRAVDPDVQAIPAKPPVEGARLGKDPSGQPAWYVPDPNRPNHYLRVS